MVDIVAVLVATAALGILVWVAKHDATGWKKI